MRSSLRHMRNLMIVLFAISSLAACSKSGSSTISLSMPDWSAMHSADMARQSKVSSLSVPDNAVLKIVAVNVTSSDISPVITRWENNDAGTLTGPTSFSLSVPRGSGRLIQVVAVFEPTNGGGMQFYYADQKIDLNSSDAAADLTLTNVASTQNLVEGNLIGQFVEAGGTGYTGAYQYRFNPPSNVGPSVVISDGEMFNGWGTLFSLSSKLIGYTKPDGSPLTSFEMTNDTPSLFKTAQSAVRISVPQAYQNTSRNGNSSYDMQLAKQKRYVVGYFGPGVAADQRVCISNTPVAVDRLYKTLGATTTAQPTDQIGWAGSPTSTSTDPDTTQYSFVERYPTARGGNPNATCVTTDDEAFAKYIYVYGSQLASEDSVAGFRGPFRVSAANPNNYVAAAYDTTNQRIKVSWKYLPGVANAIAGMTLLSRTVASANVANSDDDLRARDGYLCQAILDAGGSAWTVTNIDAVDSASNPVEVGYVPNIANQATSDRTQVLVCPRSKTAGKLFSSGRLATTGNYGGGGGGGNSQLAIIAPLSNTSSTGCSAVIVKTQVNGVDTVTTTAVPVTISFSGLAPTLYSDNACATQITASPQATIAAQASSATVYMRSTGNGLTSINASTSSGYNSAAMQTVAFGWVSGSAQNITGMFTGNSNAQAVGLCYPLQVGLTGSPGYVNTAVRSVALSVTGTGAAGSFFTDANCTAVSAITAVPFAATEFFKVVYFSPTAVAAGGLTVQAQEAGFYSGSAHNIAGVTSVAANQVDHYSIETADATSNTQQGFYGACTRVRVNAVAVNGAVVPSGSAINLTLGGGGSDNAMFSSDSSCSSPAATITTSISANSNYGSQYVYVSKSPTVGLTQSTTLFTAFVGGTAVGSPFTINRQPDNFMYTGFPSSVMENFCQPLVFAPIWGGVAASVPASMMVTATGTNGAALYTDVYCTTSAGANPTFTFNTGTSASQTVYVKSNNLTSPGGYTVQFAVQNSAAGSNALGTKAVTSWITPNFAVRLDAIGANSTGSVTSQQCLNVSVTAGVPVNAAISLPIALSGPLFGTNFYSDNTCQTVSGTNASISLMPGDTTTNAALYIKAASGAFNSYSTAGSAFSVSTTLQQFGNNQYTLQNKACSTNCPF